MDNVSIWHWLIVFFAIALLPLLVAAIAARSNKGQSRMSRGGYTLRVVGMLIGVIVIAALIAKSVIPAVIWILATAFIAYWSVDRMRDAGETGRWKAILTGLPVIGLFFCLYLMFLPSEPAQG
jgi:hypothetical protein